MFDPHGRAAGEKREDHATDAEVAAYWLQYCRDAVGRAAEIRRAKRGRYEVRTRDL
jgi:hypothetical protein